MSIQAEEPERPAWQAAPLIDWLLDAGRFLDTIDDLTLQLGDRMVAAGAPIWRLRLSMRVLHPLTTAVTSVWERGDEAPTRTEATHGLEGRSGYVGSPFEAIARTGQPFRKRLADGLTDADHNVLHELRARGGTDYFALPLWLSAGTSAVGVIATDAPDGFSENDIGQFKRVASVLAPIIEIFRARRLSVAVAEVYLGGRTGRRVLDGQITRGHIDTIDAAILISDIRDWTGMNSRLDAEDVLALANDYFSVIADAVEGHGGEILKFIGDSVLAIFPVEADGADDRTACANALAAARAAVSVARDTATLSDLQFGLGIHFGEVLYGNVGSPSRLDFTVLGQAVNIAARIESLCGRLGIPILFSDDFAARLDEPTVVAAEETLKGLDRPTVIRTIPS